MTLQQQVTNKLALEVGYIGDHGSDLSLIYNRNFANEMNLLFNGTDGALSQFPIFTLADSAVSHYDSLMVRVRAADWHGLRANASWSFSKSIDNASVASFQNEPVTFPNITVGYGFFGQGLPQDQCTFFALACNVQFSTAYGSVNLALSPPVIPNFNFSPGALTTTGAGAVLTSRYLLPQDPFNFLRDDRGPSDFNSKHRLVLDYSWELPRIRKHTTWLDYWQASGVFTAQSGQPFSIFAGPIANEFTQRVNLIGPVHVTDNPNGAISTSGIELAAASGFCSGTPLFIPPTPSGSGFSGNFLQPAPGKACTGDSGRNAFVGPAYVNMNFAIQKGFPLFGEGRLLSLRTEFYNLFDRANYFNPISQYSLDGQTINPEFGKIKSAHEARQIQFASRFSW